MNQYRDIRYDTIYRAIASEYFIILDSFPWYDTTVYISVGTLDVLKACDAFADTGHWQIFRIGTVCYAEGL